MNESSRFNDVFFDWAIATVFDMAPVSWTVVRSFIQRWALLDLPSGSGDGSCGRPVALAAGPAAPVGGETPDEGDASAGDAPRAAFGLLRPASVSPSGEVRGGFVFQSITMHPIHSNGGNRRRCSAQAHEGQQ